MSLPRKFSHERLPRGGVRYRLPTRGSQEMRLMGIFTVAVVLGINAIIVGALVLVAAGLVEPETDTMSRWGALGFALVFGGIMVVLLRGAPAKLGVCEIEIQDGYLRSVNRLGPLRRTKSIPADQVRGLDVTRYPYAGSAGDAGRFPRDWAAIDVRSAGDKQMLMAAGYPRYLLSPLAQTLADELSRRWGIVLAASGDGAIAVEDQWIEDQLAADATEPPAASRADVARVGDELRISVPPSGISGGTGRMLKGLLAFAVVFVLMGTGLLAVALPVGIAAGGWAALLVVGFIACLLAVGLLSLYETTTRRVELTAGGGRLEVRQSGVFGSNRRAWAVSEIAVIRPDFSSYQMGRKTCMELRIHSQNGERFGLLPMRDERELQWLATLLRHQLGVPAYTEEEHAPRDPYEAPRTKFWSPLGAVLGGAPILAVLLVGTISLMAMLVAPTVSSTLPQQVPRNHRSTAGSSAEPQRLVGHRQAVTAAAFAPEERTLASASTDRTVRLWDLATAESRAVCEGHRGFVYDVSFSPDGERIVSVGQDGTIRFWNSADGTEETTLEGDAGPILAVAFSPDGRALAGGLEDQTVRLWDVDSGRPAGTLAGHTGPVQMVAFSGDGRWLATAAPPPEEGGEGGEVLIWDLRNRHDGDEAIRDAPGSPAIHAKLAGPPAGPNSIAFASDTLAAANAEDKTVRLWSAESSKELQRWEEATGPLAFSPDGRLLAVCRRAGVAGGAPAIEVREVATGNVTQRYDQHVGRTITSLAFSPDGTILASTGRDMLIRLWH